MGIIAARRLQTAILLVVALGFLGGAALASHALAGLTDRPRPQRELMYFPSGRLLSALALGNRTLAADLVWLRGLQYYGQHRLTDRRYDHIGHIFDVATRLDRRFLNAYLFGGLVLAAEGEDVDGALRLMRRGLAWNPHSHELAFEIGFLYHIARRDYGHAAYFYQRALREPGCPEHVARFAAFACERSQLTGDALALWEEVLRSSTRPALRRLAAERVAKLRAAGAPAAAVSAAPPPRREPAAATATPRPLSPPGGSRP